jgi:hypothetical protein
VDNFPPPLEPSRASSPFGFPCFAGATERPNRARSAARLKRSGSNYHHARPRQKVGTRHARYRCAWLRSRPSGAFDTPCAWRSPESVGTKGVPEFLPTPPARVEQRAVCRKYVEEAPPLPRPSLCTRKGREVTKERCPMGEWPQAGTCAVRAPEAISEDGNRRTGPLSYRSSGGQQLNG